MLGVGNVFVADRDHGRKFEPVAFDPVPRGGLRPAQGRGGRSARGARSTRRSRCSRISGNIVYDLGLGVYRWADVILGGLDNREARVAINQATARAGKVWIDGAIERLDGVARVFDPATGPCYECTMGENDWKMLEARRSCALLSRGEMEQGKVPTTPTTASIIAGIQIQEAVKLLHGLETSSPARASSSTARITRATSSTTPARTIALRTTPIGRVEMLPWASAIDPRRRPARAGPLRPRSRGRHRDRPATCSLRCIAPPAARKSRSSLRSAR